MAHATTLEEALTLMKACGLLGPDRFTGLVVHPGNWNLNPEAVSSWVFDSGGSLVGFGPGPEDWCELDVGHRYLLRQPFDMEIRPEGFVVWSAADWRVSRQTEVFHPSDEFKRRERRNRRLRRLNLGPKFIRIDEASRTEIVHTTFSEPAKRIPAGVGESGLITGLALYGQFPMDEVEPAWRPSDKD